MDLYSKYFTTRSQVICILFFSYIYDLVRAGYFEAKRKHQRLLTQRDDSISAYFNCNCTSRLPPSSSRVLEATPLGKRIALVNKLADLWTQIRPSTGEPWWNFRGSKLPRAPNQNIAAQHDLGLTPPLTQQTEPSLTSATTTLPPTLELNLGNIVTVAPIQATDADEVDDCPLEELPTFIRIYEYISHSLVALSFAKYVLLSLLYSELFGLKKIYSCYIPGRTAVLPKLSPSFPFLVLLYHVVYRLYLRIIRKSFHIDCFVFVLYDQQHIRTVESQYKQIAQRQEAQQRHRRRHYQSPSVRSDEMVSPEVELEKLVLDNRIFFIRMRPRMSRKFTYKMRSNRNLEHWLKLKKFFHQYALICVSNFAVWSLPLGILVLVTVLSESNFTILYGHCNVLSDDFNPNKWTWGNWRRYIWFIFDMVDSGWLLFDTANALVWPFSSMVLCAQDMTYSGTELIDSMSSLTFRLERWLLEGQQKAVQQSSSHQPAPPSSHKLSEASCLSQSSRLHGRLSALPARNDDSRGRALSSISDDILALQNEIDDILNQMSLVDEFVSKLASFCIICWIITNLYYQIMSLNQGGLLVRNAAIQFMQATALAAITLSFAYLANTHTKFRRLYNQICNLVALDPNHQTKASWLWVLEYYQKDISRYSFHMGPFAELTLFNYLRSVSWLITGALVTISLFKQKYRLEDTQIEGLI